MTRRAGVGLLLLFLLCASGASAAVPPGPRIAFVESSEGAHGQQIRTLGPAGEEPQSILAGKPTEPFPAFMQPLSWSGDGSALTFDAIGPQISKSKKAHLHVYVAGADGSSLKTVEGGTEGFGPVIGPDGSSVAFIRSRHREKHGKVTYVSNSIWIADLGSGKVRQVTAWKNGVSMEPTSFSPDGQTLAAVRLKSKKAPPEIVLLGIASGGIAPLRKNSTDAVFSPDGSRLAFISLSKNSTDLYAMGVDGSGVVRLTKSKGAELYPSWDPSGQRIAFTRLPSLKFESVVYGFGASIRQVNADGSCESTLLQSPGIAYYGAAWEPGTGREAGRIAC